MTGQGKCQVIGYARVSAADQNLGRQLKALDGCDRVFSDKVSGKSTDREQLQEMLRYVREGDTLRVTSPDRLARSTRDLLAMVEELKGRGVAVEFLDNPALNTDTPQGAFMLTILGAVAELERSVIRERQLEGIALAKAAGKYDKSVKLTAEQIEDARQKVDSGVPKAVLARELGVSRQTLYTALSGTGRYAEAAS
ncbi:recombinase family protein [Rarobacter faecitabidus]|uniref:DNA invertase Pin-like site-specific DNA recombinase n=1 Tax=Rarobacter faecitabidus TaxID=13243 RepID=A0A542ZAT0_RARFA|nr:recombinase family protein [Rarobacter faecitabidus]TQL57435.1 DNA invertase Pin-like site-specific DNA recombinase [Rarobacter faecitabidus]